MSFSMQFLLRDNWVNCSGSTRVWREQILSLQDKVTGSQCHSPGVQTKVLPILQLYQWAQLWGLQSNAQLNLIISVFSNKWCQFFTNFWRRVKLAKVLRPTQTLNKGMNNEFLPSLPHLDMFQCYLWCWSGWHGLVSQHCSQMWYCRILVNTWYRNQVFNLVYQALLLPFQIL